MAASEVEDPLEEMERENEIALRLVERMAEMGQSLTSGTSIPSGEIAEGLRLLAQYRAVHGTRFLDKLQPEAQAVAMPMCFEHLDEIVRGRAAAIDRYHRAASVLGEYRPDDLASRQQLAHELDVLTQTDYEAIRYENDYPLSCLRATLPDQAAERLRVRFSQSAKELADLERHIEHFLSREPVDPGSKFAIKCAAPGCAASGQAETYPARNGYLGLRAPLGWKIVPGAPHRSASGGIAVDIDFTCPAHTSAPVVGKAAVGETGAGTTEPGAHPTRRPGIAEAVA